MGQKMKRFNSIIVVARKDGRGGVRPFGSYNKTQAGATVSIMNKDYKVTTDGRVNIPKSIMDKGIKGADGRMRIEMRFATKSVVISGKKDYWNTVIAEVRKPVKKYADAGSYYRPQESSMDEGDIYESDEFNEYSFS